MRQEERWIWAILHLRSKRAAEELVRAYYDEIYAFAYRQLLDCEDARDVTQECFISVLQSLQRFDGKRASFRTWIYRVAAHKVIDLRRKKTRRQALASWEDRDSEEEGGQDFTARVEDRLLLEQADAFMRKQPRELQELFRMRLYGGLSFPEISRQLQEPEEKIKARYYRLIGRLRKELGADGKE